jgi:hypothetical protein
LKAWAKASGYWIRPSDFERHDALYELAEEGEAQVYADVPHPRVVKRNDGMVHGTWLEFYDRLVLHNVFFPEAPYTFRGLSTREGRLAAIVQSKIQNRFILSKTCFRYTRWIIRRPALN